MSKAVKVAVLFLLLVAAVNTLVLHDRVVASNGATEVLSRYDLIRAELNSRGRLPMSGYVAGEINNLWQVARHPMSPGDNGCVDQTEYTMNHLGDIPGWHFRMRSAVGLDSPILLPHYWVEGIGPRGQVVEIDAWGDVFLEL